LRENLAVYLIFGAEFRLEALVFITALLNVLFP
jgi:hypothetical protein